MTRDCARELFQESDKYSHIGCLQMIDVAGKLLNIQKMLFYDRTHFFEGIEVSRCGNLLKGTLMQI